MSITIDAQQISEKIPLVHFPASVSFSNWKNWESIKPRALITTTTPSAPFEHFRWKHAFTYAGPSCFSKNGHVGDVSVYFPPGIETGKNGNASPFDSGSLEPPDARLQPYAQKSETERWNFLQSQCNAIITWRTEFYNWLLQCYANPRNYLKSSDNRYAAGAPDRTIPPDILQHNGEAGRTNNPGIPCADRRAWTWEVRFEEELKFEDAYCFHVPHSKLSEAHAFCDQLGRRTGKTPKVIPFRHRATAGAEYLYLYSQEILEEAIFR